MLRSTASTVAFGNILDSSIAIHPVPVPKSRMLFGCNLEFSMCSIKVSVSGLGIKTSELTS